MVESVRVKVQLEWVLDIPKDRASSVSVRELVSFMDKAAMNVAGSNSLAALVSGSASWSPVRKEA